MKRTLMCLAMAFMVLAIPLLSACGGGTPTEVPIPTPSPLGVTVTDAQGRTVEFPELPRRIVIAGKATLMVANTLYLFPEAGERLIAVTGGQQQPGRFLLFVDPAFGEKTLLEPEAGPEQIAPLDPDAVILRSIMAEKLGRPLEELSIPVIYVDPETPEQFFRDLATLGQLLGNQTRAEAIRSYYQARLDSIAREVEGLDPDEKPRVLLLQHSTQGGDVALNVPSVSWIQTTMAELAGGVPIWAEAAQGGGWTVVNFEQIAAWDPDKVFLISYAQDPAEIVSQLKADPQWRALKAVQEGQIYGFAGDIYSWDQPDPRWILGLGWLAGSVHPDRFAGLDPRQEAASFFQQMYGMEEGAVREHILSNLQGDVP
jgi:iron complex transport system substrate-binding protein